MVSSEINIKQKMADTIRFLASDMVQQSKLWTPRGSMGLCRYYGSFEWTSKA